MSTLPYLGSSDQHQSTSAADGSSSQQQSPSYSLNSATLDHRTYRRILRQCVATICYSAGFHSAQAGSLDALTILLNNFFASACQSSRALCEHTGRSLVTAGDVYLALVNEGRPELSNFDDFLRNLRRRRQHTLSLRSQSPPQLPAVLRVSDPRPHPTHFPSFLPPFPDPHTYIRTEVRDEVDANYERVRRLNSQNKRDWEASLIKYALSQYPTACVFRELEAHLAFEAKDALEKQREHRHRMRQQQLMQQQQAASKATQLGKSVGEDVAMMNGEEDGEDELLPSTDELPDKVVTEKGTLNVAGRSTTPVQNAEQKNNGLAAVGQSGGADANATTGDPLFEELFDPIDTERSYVLKRIPHYCHVLLPFEEPRPYLSALLTDDADHVADDEQYNDYFARILSKEMDDEGDESGMAADGGGRTGDEPMEMGAE